MFCYLSKLIILIWKSEEQFKTLARNLKLIHYILLSKHGPKQIIVSSLFNKYWHRLNTWFIKKSHAKKSSSTLEWELPESVKEMWKFLIWYILKELYV